MGSGLFDRFSSARRTLGRGSIRRKNDFGYGDDDANTDTRSLMDITNERKKSGDNWRSR